MPRAVILMGPPGSGKGTQAQLVAKHIGGTWYDTGEKIRERLARGEIKKKGYPEGYRRGKLLDPEITLGIVLEDTRDALASRLNVVFSGSPRSVIEAFGLRGNGLMNTLEEAYGKENILVFHIRISLEESLKRNLMREDRRSDDTRETLITRYKEQYEKSIMPALEEIKDRGYRVIDIDGMPSPEKVFGDIREYL